MTWKAVSRVWNKGRLCTRSRLLCQLLCRYGPADTRVLEGCVVGRQGCCSELSSGRPYQWFTAQTGFWTKVLPFSADNLSPFGKELLVSYWVLVETENLTIGHHSYYATWAIHQELILISDWANHKVGYGQQHSIIKWKCICHQAQAGPESTSKLYDEVAHVVSNPYYNKNRNWEILPACTVISLSFQIFVTLR